MNILVIDIGGTNVKLWAPDGEPLDKIVSGANFTPGQMMRELRHIISPSDYEAVAIGYPGKVIGGKPVRDPWNLGAGWVGFNFDVHFGKPVRIMNDAAMQALGSYQGGRMLFIGLGTSVGSALIADNVVLSMELGSIPHTFGKTLEHLLARKALERMGKRAWRRAVLDVLPHLQYAFSADYVVVGGGNAKKLEHRLPPSVWIGSNRNAFRGGCRLWETREMGSVHIFEGDAANLSAGSSHEPEPPGNEVAPRLASGTKG